MEFKDYYTTLGVSKTATVDEIKSAYRKLARKYHPDVSKEPNAEQHMQAVNEANAVLSDPEKRAAYDQASLGFQPGQEFQPPPDWGSEFEYSGNGAQPNNMHDTSDFFSQLFGHAARAQRGNQTQRGEDSHARILIDVMASYQGAQQTLNLRAPRSDANGQISMVEHIIQVTIPKGIKPGQHLRVAGQGHPGFNGGPNGDLFLEIQFKSDARYRLEGVDVYSPLPLTPWEAALGAQIEVTTPAGMMQVKIPPNSQAGRKLRLKGRGIPSNPAGDLYLILEIVLPAANTERARELYTLMSKELAFNPRE